jgi:hypothetical protein
MKNSANKFYFVARNRSLKVIYKSKESYATYRQALDNGCIFLAENKEVKEISVLER